VVHSGSPVLGIERDGGRYVARTPSNVVRARTEVLATNGYTLEKLFPFLRARLMPVLSVSAPLPRFPFAAFRRLGQSIAMRWYGYTDNRR
jgi:glycine/D-amino acid oxidase-like deaminating enzyme